MCSVNLYLDEDNIPLITFCISLVRCLKFKLREIYSETNDVLDVNASYQLFYGKLLPIIDIKYLANYARDIKC